MQVVQQNTDAIALIADGCDIWNNSATPVLTSFCDLYLTRYLALPTNTQFTKRGVKELGYLSLGQMGETNWSILAIARGKILPEALTIGRKEVSLEKKRQL